MGAGRLGVDEAGLAKFLRRGTVSEALREGRELPLPV